MLVVLKIIYEHHTSLLVSRIRDADRDFSLIEAPEEIEIHGPNRQRIAVALLNNYPVKLRFHDSYGVVVTVEAGEDEEKLLKALKMLQGLKAKIRRDEAFDKLTRNPSIESLLNFLAIKRVLE